MIPGLSGRPITPADADYESARLTNNGAVDSRPALIARATSAADVQAFVRWARAARQPITVRSGGHSVAGHSTGDGAHVLDLGLLNDIEIDPSPAAAWAWVGAGARAADFTSAAYARGRGVSFGDTGSVGLGGLIPGGGIGWLVRRQGLTIDSLLAAEVVTASGDLVTADAAEHADLFWALRGGGGNFGIVSRYKLALRPIGRVQHGMLLLPGTPAIVRAVIEIGLGAPDDLTLMPFLMAIPPMPEVAVEHHGELGLWCDTLWAGEPAAGAPLLERLRGLGPPIMDAIADKPYPEVYPAPAEPVEGAARGGWTSSSIFFDEIGDGVLDTVYAALRAAPEGDCLVIFRVLGGALARVPADATAFAWRAKKVLAWIIAAHSGDGAATMPAYRGWVRDLRAALAGWGEGAFVSFLGDDSPDMVAAAYPPPTLARLREVKRRYDPDNLFRRNHNILPADGA
ncbi:MAG TPA: FAD-binding oxidoreductase [Candidatus Limnocylindrales bacterium]